MSEPSGAREGLVRRYLETVRDVGAGPIFLETLSRDEAIGRLRPPVPSPAGGPRRPPSSPAAPDERAARRRSEPSDISDAAIAGAPDLEALNALVERCGRCPLHRSRTRAVFGEGDPSARVVCVGEAPGAREDETGRPFVGRAGQLLDRLLRTIGLERESVYICNVLKSRPPGNRDPLPEEVAACSPFLVRQLDLIRPEVVIAFGAFAARTLLDTRAALGRLRGEVHRYAGYPVIVTYHPAALLRNPGWTRATWEDLQRVRRVLDDGVPAPPARAPTGGGADG